MQELANIQGTDGGRVTVELPYLANGHPRDPDLETHNVYFIYSAGFVKIGKALKHRVVTRMGEIQVGTPFNVWVVLLIPGGRLTEDYHQTIFGEYHARGEWFYLGGRLEEMIRKEAPPAVAGWLDEEIAQHRVWVTREAETLAQAHSGFVLPYFTNDNSPTPPSPADEAASEVPAALSGPSTFNGAVPDRGVSHD